MANKRGHPKLSYEVWKVEFHPQVAEIWLVELFKLIAPRTRPGNRGAQRLDRIR